MKNIIISIIIISFSIGFFSCSKKNETTKNEQKTEEKKETAPAVTNPFHIKYESKKENEKNTMELWVKGKNFKMEIISIKGDNKDVSIMYYKDKVAYMMTDIGGEKMNMKADISKELEKTLNFEITSVKDNIKDYQKIGEEELLGNKCTVYMTKEGDKFSIYKENYVLKVVDKNNVMFTATVFEPDVKLDDELISPPKDIVFENMEDMMK